MADSRGVDRRRNVLRADSLPALRTLAVRKPLTGAAVKALRAIIVRRAKDDILRYSCVGRKEVEGYKRVEF